MAIKYIANLCEEPFLIEPGSFNEFKEFIEDKMWFQLDFETNPAHQIGHRYLRSMQFGEWDPKRSEDDKEQWFLEWNLLTQEQKDYVLSIINDPNRVKVGQNLGFEAQMLRKYDIYLNNIRDTMLREKIIYTGMSKTLDEDGATFFSLESITRRRLSKELSKEFQTLFGDENPLTVGHIIYGAQDVGDLDKIYQIQEEELNKFYDVPVKERTIYNYLPMLEDEASLAFADIVYNGMKLDTEKWLSLEKEVEPIISEKYEDLRKLVLEDETLFQKAIELNYYFREDTLNINYNSPVQKRELFLYAFPELEGPTKQNLKGWLIKATKEGRNNTEQFKIINDLFAGEYEGFSELMVKHCKDYLIEKGYLIPEGSFIINWSSSEQVTPLLSSLHPIDSSAKEVLENFPHQIGYAILEYRQALKLKTTYGEKFLEHVDADGYVRTNINQILETGRISTSKPNMQQIPAYESVGTKYRNCFITEPGWVYVDSDYSSQELVIIAEISKDPVWLEALKKGEDLHSVTAALVYKKKWDDATEEGCVYKLHKQKCSCKGHKRLRTGIKSINFGLAYGMSAFKLAADMKISVKEAEALINEYFKTFPEIGKKLTQLGWYGITKGHIMTLAPYKRKRFFPLWQQAAKHAQSHIQGIRYNPILGAIERASKNTPIQGSAADMTKLALVLIRRFILQKGLQDQIKLVMQVHDQITTICTEDYKERWPPVFTKLMEMAGKTILPSGLLKAETTVSVFWTK